MDITIKELLDKLTPINDQVGAAIKMIEDADSIEGHSDKEKTDILAALKATKAKVSLFIEKATAKKDEQQEKSLFGQAAKLNINPFSRSVPGFE